MLEAKYFIVIKVHHRECLAKENFVTVILGSVTRKYFVINGVLKDKTSRKVFVITSKHWILIYS